MATKQEKEELIEILRFTPVTYRIELGNYGGEVYAGKVDRKIYDYFKQNSIDLDEYNGDWDNELGIPEDMQPFPPGSPYECDDLIHASGATMDDGNLVQVFDENGNVVWECALDTTALDEEGIEVEEYEEFYLSEIPEGEVVYWGAQGEKGLLFGGEIELKQPFDPKKLKFTYSDADGWYLCSGVSYDGEDIDNNDVSTTGKWGENKWIIGGDEEVYDPEDSWEVPDCGPSPDDWEKSPEFKFKKHKPVHQGWYRCNWGYGTTYGSLYWNGTNFVEFNYGKEEVISAESIVSWQGYNWDTSSWVNQPPIPVDIQCSNKKCGWVGMGSDRIDDDNYDSHCPECNGIEFSWIEYDPDTAKGRKNREKYCKPWDPALALKRIPVPEQDLEAALEELKDEFEAICNTDTSKPVVLPKGSWPF
jgi:hypothetical protein